MKIIKINSPPVKTEKGVVSDFLNAVLEEQKVFRTGQFYQFGENVIVSFFDGKNGKTGMDIHRKIKGRENLYQVTRISSTQTRKNLGRIEII